MPVFNAERFLQDSLQSVLSQSFRDYELIAVDDGSTDRSLAILREFLRSDHRIRVVSRPNTGLVGALNDGLDFATGEFVARMDADDISVPFRFQRQVDFLKTNPQFIAVSGAFCYVDDAGLPLYNFSPPLDSKHIAEKLRLGCGEAFLHGAAMFRREALLRVGAYRRECEHVEDVDLFLRLLQVGELSNVSDILLHYRMHEQSICHRHREEQQKKLHSLLGLETSLFPKRNQSISFRENLAYTALRAGNFRTARVNALKDLCNRPFCCRTLLILIAALTHFRGKGRITSSETSIR